MKDWLPLESDIDSSQSSSGASFVLTACGAPVSGMEAELHMQIQTRGTSAGLRSRGVEMRLQDRKEAAQARCGKSKRAFRRMFTSLDLDLPLEDPGGLWAIRFTIFWGTTSNGHVIQILPAARPK